MTDNSKPISATARAVLTLAASRDDHLVQLPRLPVAAARQVVRSMLNAGLVEELPAATIDRAYVWRTTEHGEVLALRATALGQARVAEGASAAIALVSAGSANEAPAEAGVPDGADPEVALTTLVPTSEGMPSTTAPMGQGALQRPDDADSGDDTAPASTQAAAGPWKPTTAVELAGRRDRLRQAAEALLDAWDDPAGGDRNISDALVDPIDGLRAALAGRTLVSAKIGPPRTPKDTKYARVLAMLRRDEGASGPQIADAMGWAPHTVRGFLAGLAKKGIVVEVLERVRQINSNTGGAKGSYTIYQINGS